MTNITRLPQLSGSFSVATNADWRDEIMFVLADGSPLDLTGIEFEQHIRPDVASVNVILKLSTSNGLLINGGSGGRLAWHVPVGSLRVGGGTYVTDLVARADGITINLFRDAPAALAVHHGVTR